MVKHAIKCGNGGVVRPGGFRVVARLVDARDALVALADTHAEAVRAAWAHRAALPEGAARLGLERWFGPRACGGWVAVRTTPGDLPWVVRPVRRGRLVARARGFAAR